MGDQKKKFFFEFYGRCLQTCFSLRIVFLGSKLHRLPKQICTVFIPSYNTKTEFFYLRLKPKEYQERQEQKKTSKTKVKKVPKKSGLQFSLNRKLSDQRNFYLIFFSSNYLVILTPCTTPQEITN